MKLEDWYKKTESPEEREYWRKVRRQEFWRMVRELIGLFLLTVLVVVLFWLYLAITPPQASAINDLEAEEATP